MWQRLQNEQAVFSRIFFHQMERKQKSHAYLLVGDYSTQDAALFMAASFNCVHGVVACEKCSRCQRIFSHNYSDVLEVGNGVDSIKKEDILSLKKRFSVSSLEDSKEKVYIINGVDNATPESMNALLKYLEEPESQSTIAILVAKSLDNVLETIQSRCQIFRFNSANASTLLDLALSQEIEQPQAFLLSKLSSNQNDLESQMNDQAFNHISNQSTELLKDLLENRFLGFIALQNSVSRKGGFSFIEFNLFLQMFIIQLEELLKDNTSIFPLFSTELIQKNKKYFLHYLTVSITIRDKLTKSVNLPLLVDQMCYMLGRETDE